MRLVRTTLLLTTGLACAPSQESVHVQREVKLDGSKIAATTNDLGWTVTLSAVRLAVTDVQFSILGEMHQTSASLGGWLIRRAWAHPGHYAGGDVTGELPGNFIFDWIAHDGMKLGDADMLTGVYHGINLTFRHADADDKLASDDPLLDHTGYYAGVARKDGRDIAFTIVADINEGTQMVGAPFDWTLEEDTPGTIEIQLYPTDPVEGKSMFDGLDFGALDEDGDGEVSIAPGDTAHNIFVRLVQSHVHYRAEAR